MNKQKLGIIVFGVGILIIVGGWLSIVFNVSQTTNIQEANQTDTIDDETTSTGTGDTRTDNQAEQQGVDLTENQGSLLDNENTPQDITVTNETPRRVITILFPPFYTQQQINALSSVIANESGIETDARRLEGWGQYLTAMNSFLEKGGSIDMMVIPSNYFPSATEWGLKFTLPTDLQRFYHSSFHKWMYNQAVTVIPFALDPLVLYQNKAFTQQQQFTTINELVRFIAGLTRPNFLPVGQGFDSGSIPGLETKTEPFLHAQSVMQGLIRYSVKYTSLDRLGLLINAPHRSSTTAQQQHNIIKQAEQSEACGIAPMLCMVTAGKSAVGFGLLSESYYFEEVITKTDQFTITDVPFRGGHDYPMLGRGIVINKNTTRLAEVERWISHLLTLSVETNQVPYPWYMFAPTYSMMQRQGINKTVEQVQSFKFNGVLIDNAPEETVSHSIYDEAFIDLLGSGRSLRQYLQQQATLTQ